MTSVPLDSTHGQITSAWHTIIALGKHTRSNDVGRGMPSLPFGSIHGRTTSGVAGHHRLWTSSYSRMASGVAFHHRPLTEKGGRMTLGVACHHRLWEAHTVDVLGRGITSPPLDSTTGRTKSGVACNDRLWKAHTVEQRRAWHAIIALGRQTRSNVVGRGMPSLPLDRTHDQTASGMTCHLRLWTTHTVERRRAWQAIIAFGVAHTVGRRRAWHSFIAL